MANTEEPRVSERVARMGMEVGPLYVGVEVSESGKEFVSIASRGLTNHTAQLPEWEAAVDTAHDLIEKCRAAMEGR